MSDPIQYLGKTIPPDAEVCRDAIHVAVLPVVADEYVAPGQKVKFSMGSQTHVRPARDHAGSGDAIGVIDPFLKTYVEEGTRCYVFLFPGTIKGMRHHWYHPAIDDPPKPMNPSELWLRQFAERWEMDYHDMIEQACNEDYIIGGTENYDMN